MRTTAPRLAEEKSVHCGKRRAPLRKTNGDFAGFLVKICKRKKTNVWENFLFGAERKECLSAKTIKKLLFATDKRNMVSFCHSALRSKQKEKHGKSHTPEYEKEPG